MQKILRRPVAGNSVKHVKEPSLASSSIYSEPAEPEIPKPNFSEHSLESINLNDDNSDDDFPPQLPVKQIYGNKDPPPLPPKDAARPFRLADSSFQKPEIWKRRSRSRSNSDLSFEDLKLQKSNGSTASSSSPPRIQPHERSLPLLPRYVPEKSVLRKAARFPFPPPPPPPPPPSHLSPTLPLQPQADYMGSKNSKLRKKESYGSSASPSHLPGRLPTPDYQNTDKQHVATPTIRSPESPVSPDSPHLSSHQQSSLKQVNSIFKAARTPNNLPPIQTQNSLDSDLVFEHSRSSSDTLTIVAPTESTIFSAPQPQKANPAARILTPQPTPPSTVTIRSPPPQTPKSPFSARAIAFQNAGTIHPGPEINASHYDCYQEHRFMRPSRNEKCPLGCMACDKLDTEKRWSCTWCDLRICTRCMETLTANGKDLRAYVAKVRKRGDHTERGRTQSNRTERAG